MEKQYQEKCLLMLAHALQSYKESISEGRHISDAERVQLFSKYQLLVSSVLMATLPHHFPGSYPCLSLITSASAYVEFGLLRTFFLCLTSLIISLVTSFFAP